MRVVMIVLLIAVLIPVAIGAQVVPEITSHTVNSLRNIEFVCSHYLHTNTVAWPGKIRISPASSPADTLETYRIYLDEDQVTIHVYLIDEMVSGTSYTFSVNGQIYTPQTGVDNLPAGYEYEYIADDLVPPTLVAVHSFGSNQIELQFSEDLIETSSETSANYLIFETGNAANIFDIQYIRMRGLYDKIYFELDKDLVEGTDYTIVPTGLNDISGNALLPGSEIVFTYSNTNGPTLMGLYKDSERHSTAINGVNPYTFDMWMWVKPDINGVLASAFTIDYPANVITQTPVLYPGSCFLHGDLVNGAAVAYDDCQYDWVWVFKQTLTVNDALPSIVTVKPMTEILAKGLRYFDCPHFGEMYIDNSSNIEINAADARPYAMEASFSGVSVLDILFNYALDEISSEDISNFEIFESVIPTNTVSISSASLLADGRTIRIMSLSPFSPGIDYIARMTGIKSSTGVTIYPASEIGFTAVDVERPNLASASMSGNQTVDLVFDEPVDDAAAGSVLNYDMVVTADPTQDMILHSASLMEDCSTVRLIVSSSILHGTGYTVIASNVKDLAGNKMYSARTIDFTADDVFPPELVRVNPISSNQVIAFFDETVAEASAINPANYFFWNVDHPITSIEWGGNTVTITISGSLIDEKQYSLYVDNVSDGLGNLMPERTYVHFTHIFETPQPQIGLWTDSGRLGNSVEAYPYQTFEFYVMLRPGPNGILAAEFALENVSLQNLEYYIIGTQYNSEYSMNIGDPFSGITITHYNCFHDWFYIAKYTAILIDGRGYINLIPHPIGGGPQIILCYNPYPIIQCEVISNLVINESIIGTLLQSSNAEFNGTDIEISWTMQEVEGDPAFVISRKSDKTLQYVVLDSPVIEREGMSFRYVDRNSERGSSYTYRVEYPDNDGLVTLFESEKIIIPSAELVLEQNHPNPFNPSTTIGYYLPETGNVLLEVFDVSGRRIAILENSVNNAGDYKIEWNGLDSTGNRVSSGIYFYRLTAGKKTISKKMVLMR